VKVADFGLSRPLDKDIYEITGLRFPVRWTAPEVFKYRKYTSKSDTWSLGITIYEIITFGRVPYGGMENQEVVQKVVDGYRIPQPEECREDLWKIVIDCWKEDPEARPTLAEVARRLGNLINNTESDSESSYHHDDSSRSSVKAVHENAYNLSATKKSDDPYSLAPNSQSLEDDYALVS